MTLFQTNIYTQIYKYVCECMRNIDRYTGRVKNNLKVSNEEDIIQDSAFIYTTSGDVEVNRFKLRCEGWGKK